MFDDSSEETDFWRNVPDRRLDRFRRSASRPARARTEAQPVRTREHGDHTGDIPVVVAPARRAGSHDRKAPGTAPIDPLLKRLGALVVVTAVLVPVALSFRSDDSDSVGPAHVQAEAAVSASSSTGDGGTVAVVGAPNDTGSTGSDNSSAVIDVDALPPAIPVNPDPASTAATALPADAQTQTRQSPGTVAATAPAAQAQTQAKVASSSVCPKKYTIANGDAWILIAQRTKVTLKSLLSVNRATSSTSLYPGRTICLPANASKPVVKSAATSTTAKPVVKAPTTTVPKATTTTPTPPKPPTRTYTKAQVAQIIRDVWPDNLEDKAVAIATRESNLTPTAKNNCCYGLFQIYFKVHARWLAGIGVTSARQLYDPRTNAYAAYLMYTRSGGWGPWGG